MENFFFEKYLMQKHIAKIEKYVQYKGFVRYLKQTWLNRGFRTFPLNNIEVEHFL